MTEPENFDREIKIYESIWRNMERECALINFRVQWAIFLSGGLLATEGVLASTLVDFKKGAPVNIFDLVVISCVMAVMLALSSIGAWFCYRSRAGVIAAQNQIDYLKTEYLRLQERFERKYCFPRPFGDNSAHSEGNNAALAFPKVMMVIWGLFIVIQLSTTIGASSIAFERYNGPKIATAPAPPATPPGPPVSSRR